ncbi:transforming acidic coiled-coil-containing protein 3 [Malaya genurostris]|uniref:transforming acidic coiled-coil-containing protein 3 n=1 Tax=Malaya genurostris TaxID=325434 RepID=UPI0026F3C51D|nr:transforming acidic coiled-coil-containing protein 3 [Malaya genurostris]
MSDEEAQVASEESGAEETPKKGRGRPKKEGSASAEADSSESGRGKESPEPLPAEENILAPPPQPVEFYPSECQFKTPFPPSFLDPSESSVLLPTTTEEPQQQQQQQQHLTIEECEFQPAQNFEFAASDFDFLLTRGGGGGNRLEEVPRDSLLLKFDPLLKVPVTLLSTTKEEESESVGGGVLEITQLVETAAAAEEAEGSYGGSTVSLTAFEASGFAAVSPSSSSMNIDEVNNSQFAHCAEGEADEKMSVDNTVILEGESSTERNMSLSDQDFNSSNELDKKSKNESLKIEELERKLRDAESREEALVKRITDKDKTIAKMSGVVEAYERAIAELIAEKEQTTQNYEKTCEALKTDGDINAQHLESLEKTFSDLHAKYERMKIITSEYKEREEELINERNRFEESLRMQEKRYENMKSHAMAQLEIANSKLSELVRNHAQEVTKLKALLKKEEIYRASVNDQLSQKARENEELVKICEELINGGAN